MRNRGRRKKYQVEGAAAAGPAQTLDFNTVMPVLALLVLIVVLFSTGVSSYYYQSMEDGLTKQVQAQAGGIQ